MAFSAPTTSTVSCSPDAIAMNAMCSASAPDAQAFSTAWIGISPNPAGIQVTGARVDSWPVISPARQLPKKIPSIWRRSTPESASADSIADAVSSLSERSSCRPKSVMAPPRR